MNGYQQLFAKDFIAPPPHKYKVYDTVRYEPDSKRIGFIKELTHVFDDTSISPAYIVQVGNSGTWSVTVKEEDITVIDIPVSNNYVVHLREPQG